METAQLLVASRDGQEVQLDDRLGEAHYGDWTGKEIKKLAKDPLWKVVQTHPALRPSPGGGESLRDTQARAVDAVREWNASRGPRRPGWLAPTEM